MLCRVHADSGLKTTSAVASRYCTGPAKVCFQHTQGACAVHGVGPVHTIAMRPQLKGSAELGWCHVVGECTFRMPSKSNTKLPTRPARRNSIICNKQTNLFPWQRKSFASEMNGFCGRRGQSHTTLCSAVIPVGQKRVASSAIEEARPARAIKTKFNHCWIHTGFPLCQSSGVQGIPYTYYVFAEIMNSRHKV